MLAEKQLLTAGYRLANILKSLKFANIKQEKSDSSSSLDHRLNKQATIILLIWTVNKKQLFKIK